MPCVFSSTKLRRQRAMNVDTIRAHFNWINFLIWYCCQIGTDIALIFLTKKLHLHELTWFDLACISLKSSDKNHLLTLNHAEKCHFQCCILFYINISINEIERKINVDGHHSALIEQLTSFCFNKLISISIFFWNDVIFTTITHATTTHHFDWLCTLAHSKLAKYWLIKLKYCPMKLKISL